MAIVEFNKTATDIISSGVVKPYEIQVNGKAVVLSNGQKRLFSSRHAAQVVADAMNGIR
jgi:hypothetical protein